MPPVLPALDRCATCGQPVPDGPTCPSCGGSLAVDVLVTAPVTDGRVAFEAARAVAGLGLKGLDFGTARAALVAAARPLARGVDRRRARLLLAALDEAGVAAAARAAPPASAPVQGPRRGPRTLALALAGFAILGVAIAGGLLWSRGRPDRSTASPPGPAEASPPAAPGSTPPALAAPAPVTPPGEPSLAEVLRQALPSTAVVACQGQSGTGFFVEAEKLLTNAHVTCGEKVPLEITTGDGRQLIGKVEARDARLDWALVIVPGAGVARPLELGDSTRVAPGDPIGFIGAPRGLASTVHEGKVSFVGRNLRGVAYLQLNAAVNPGNSGGPLLDARGRVVGMVSLKINETDGLGLALPVEYFRPALAGPSPAEEAALGRWSAIRSRAEAEDAEEVARLRKDLSGPVLVAVASSGPRSLELSVMQRWTGRPESAGLVVEVQRDGRVLCRPTGRVEDWTDLAARVKKAAEPPADGRTAWLLRNDLLIGVHGGSVDVSLESCPEPIPEGARLRLEGAEGERAWFRVPAAEPTTDHERELWKAKERAEVRRQLQEVERRTNQESWRQAFKAARDRVAELEKECQRYRREIENPRGNWSQGEALQKLPDAERQLQAARQELDELERLASRKGVPREWR